MQSLHRDTIRNALRFAKTNSIRVLNKLGKDFSIKSEGRVEEWKAADGGESYRFCLGMRHLKTCVVDAFVYESAVSIESLGFLPRFSKFNVNSPEVSL